MNPEAVEQDFRNKINEKISLLPEGIGRFRVLTPFLFDDGDHLAIVLKQNNSHWVLSDEGHTYMHLTYSDLDERDLQRGTRQKIITSALSAFSIKDDEGELTLAINGNGFGDALFNFVQGLLKITDVTYLSRERVRSTFLEDFRTFLEETIPSSRRVFNWHDKQHDPEAMYSVDCRVNQMPRPLAIFALPNEDKVRDATITLLQFERWGMDFRSIGIYQDQEEINRRVEARFSDVCEKQFSNISANRDRIIRYIGEIIGERS